MAQDRSDGSDSLFAELEQELGAAAKPDANQPAQAAQPDSSDPLAELARLIDESRGGHTAKPAAPASPAPAAAPAAPQSHFQPAAPAAPSAAPAVPGISAMT